MFFGIFFNSNEVISLFCEKRQKNQITFFKIETVSEWESHVVLLLEHQWREKSRSRSWTRQISDKTIVMFYVNCSEKKFSEKKNGLHHCARRGAKWMRTFQVGLFSRLTDLRWGKGETKDISRKQDESRRAGGTQTWPARWSRVAQKAIRKG